MAQHGRGPPPMQQSPLSDTLKRSFEVPSSLHSVRKRTPFRPSCPRWPQTGPKGFQNRPKMGDMGQDGSKMSPTRLQNCFPLLFLLLFLSFPFLCFPFLSFLFLSFPFQPNGGAPQSYTIGGTIPLQRIPTKLSQARLTNDPPPLLCFISLMWQENN